MTILTIDIGTTSTKVLLFDPALNQLAITKNDYPTTMTADGFAEQNPDAIYEAVLTGIEDVLTDQPHKVKTIVFSSAMHSLMGVDRSGKPLTPLMLWSDNRAVEQIDHLKSQPEAEKFFKKTGTPIHPMSPLAKILWLKDEGTLFDSATKWIGIKEYIWYQLTGEYQVDYSIASATGLFNSETLAWDREILTYLNLLEGKLSECVDVTYSQKVISDELLKIDGINGETELVIGGSDGTLANLASIKADDNMANLSLGTSGAIRVTTKKRVIDPEGRLFCYYLRPGEWVIGGAVNNGGNVLNFLDQLLFETPGRIYDKLDKLDFTRESELIFLPHIHGERAPFWDSHLTGGWLGLTAIHTKEDLIRAAIEGILFNLVDVLKLLNQQAGPIERLTVSGGFFQNQKLVQVTSDLFGLPIELNETIEQSSLGAALLVCHEADPTTSSQKLYRPNSDQHERYQKKYQLYQKKLKKEI